MRINEILGNLQDFPLTGRRVDTVSLEWFELEKKLLRKTSAEGEELGILVEKPLQNGDVLYADDEKVIAVQQLPCTLTVTPVDSMQKMGRLCFELGNRHLSLAIEEDRVTVIYDEPTFLYLQKLGFAPEKQEGLFTHYTVCHGHSHGDDSHGGEHSHAHGHEHSHEHGHAHTHNHDEMHEHTHHHDHDHAEGHCHG